MLTKEYQSTVLETDTKKNIFFTCKFIRTALTLVDTKIYCLVSITE